MASIGAVVIACLSPSNAFCCSDPQLHGTSFDVKAVSGAAIAEKPLMNRL
jgi:hypothetical protein